MYSVFSTEYGAFWDGAVLNMNGFGRTIFRGSPIWRVQNERTFGNEINIFENDACNLRIIKMVGDLNTTSSLGITYMYT